MRPDSTILGQPRSHNSWECSLFTSVGLLQACAIWKTVVGLRWRTLLYLIWGSRLLWLLVPSSFCHFEFWQGIDKCVVLANLLFQIPCSLVAVIIFLPVPGLSTEPVRSPRGPIDLNCPDWPHLRPPTYTLRPWAREPHWRLDLGLQLLTRPFGWPLVLAHPLLCRWILLPASYIQPGGPAPLGVDWSIRGLALRSRPILSPGPGSPSPGHVCRLLMVCISNLVLLKEVLSSTFIQLLACPFHKQNAGRMAAAVLPWQDGQICLFLAAILPFVLSICSSTPLLPLGQLEGCNGQGFSSWQSRSRCTALCNADCCG